MSPAGAREILARHCANGHARSNQLIARVHLEQSRYRGWSTAEAGRQARARAVRPTPSTRLVPAAQQDKGHSKACFVGTAPPPRPESDSGRGLSVRIKELAADRESGWSTLSYHHILSAGLLQSGAQRHIRAYHNPQSLCHYQTCHLLSVQTAPPLSLDPQI